MGFMENLWEGGKMRLVSKLSRVDWPCGYMRYCTLFVIILVNLDIWCQKIARVGKCEMVYIYILVLCCILVKLIFCCKPVQLHADEIRKCPALKSQSLAGFPFIINNSSNSTSKAGLLLTPP